MHGHSADESTEMQESMQARRRALEESKALAAAAQAAAAPANQVRHSQSWRRYPRASPSKALAPIVEIRVSTSSNACAGIRSACCGCGLAGQLLSHLC